MERKKKKEEKEKEEKKRMKERRRKEKERVYLEFWVIFVFFRHLDSISITNQSLGPNNFLCVLQFTFCKSKKKKNEMWSYIWFTSQIETKKRKKERKVLQSYILKFGSLLVTQHRFFDQCLNSR